MLSPRLLNGVDCDNICNLLSTIDRKLTLLSKDLYNNTIFSLNKKVDFDAAITLVTYKRILQHRLCNSNYAAPFCLSDIAGRVIITGPVL